MMHGGWLKSKLYPLRADITADMLVDAMHEFERLGMVTLYASDGRDYFQINKWHEYQNTSREGKTSYPAPTQELVMSYSGVSHELLKRTSSYLISSDLIYSNNEKNETISALCNVCANAGASDRATLDLADDLAEDGRGAEWVRGFGAWYDTLDNGQPYLKHLRTFGGHYDRQETPHFAQKTASADIDEFLAFLSAAQRNGMSSAAFRVAVKNQGYGKQWGALGLRWADVKRMTEKQTADIRFRLLEVLK